MRKSEDGAEQDAETANNYVGNAEEGVSASNDRAGRYENRLFATVLDRRKSYDCELAVMPAVRNNAMHTVIDLQPVCTDPQDIVVIPFSQFAKGR